MMAIKITTSQKTAALSFLNLALASLPSDLPFSAIHLNVYSFPDIVSSVPKYAKKRNVNGNENFGHQNICNAAVWLKVTTNSSGKDKV